MLLQLPDAQRTGGEDEAVGVTDASRPVTHTVIVHDQRKIPAVCRGMACAGDATDRRRHCDWPHRTSKARLQEVETSARGRKWFAIEVPF